MNRTLAIFLAFLMLLPAMATGESAYDAYAPAAARAVNALSDALWAEQRQLYIYKDFADSENHYTQKSKMWWNDESLVFDMDENWQDDPNSGFSCIRCSQMVEPDDWGGWMFLSGMLPEGGAARPHLTTGARRNRDWT